jgi:hypothetical protein
MADDSVGRCVMHFLSWLLPPLRQLERQTVGLTGYPSSFCSRMPFSFLADLKRKVRSARDELLRGVPQTLFNRQPLNPSVSLCSPLFLSSPTATRPDRSRMTHRRSASSSPTCVR